MNQGVLKDSKNPFEGWEREKDDEKEDEKEAKQEEVKLNIMSQ